jgi:hypothetical protein
MMTQVMLSALNKLLCTNIPYPLNQSSAPPLSYSIGLRSR